VDGDCRRGASPTKAQGFAQMTCARCRSTAPWWIVTADSANAISPAIAIGTFLAAHAKPISGRDQHVLGMSAASAAAMT
jgi:hypothetical protein